MLPDDLAGKVRELQAYDFESAEAAQRFEQLLDKIRQQLMQQMVEQMSGAMQNMTPQDMQRMKDMIAGLNEMLERRERGEDPGFEQFMQEFGDFFPENPETLDELLEQMAKRMAAMQAMLNSMSPEQRAQLQQLSDQLLEDMDLRWQMSQLGQNLQSMFPQMGWGQDYQFEGSDPMGMGQAMQTMQELGDLDQLENLLRNATSPGALAEADMDRVRDLMGDDAARSLQRLAELTKMLQDAGLIEQKEGRLELTPKGLRKIGSNALARPVRQAGQGQGRSAPDRPPRAGPRAHVRDQAVRVRRPVQPRSPQDHPQRARRNGTGTPVHLSPDDFEIERTEHLTRSSTVLMLDLSLSMPMRDNFLPAKKVAMALHSLITSQFPATTWASSGSARRPASSPRRSFPRCRGTSSTAPTCSTGSCWPDTARQAERHQADHHDHRRRTDRAHHQQRRCVLQLPAGARDHRGHVARGRALHQGQHPHQHLHARRQQLLKSFIEKLTSINRGRAFFTTPETLGDYVLVDFIEHKKQLARGKGARRAG